MRGSPFCSSWTRTLIRGLFFKRWQLLWKGDNFCDDGPWLIWIWLKLLDPAGIKGLFIVTRKGCSPEVVVKKLPSNYRYRNISTKQSPNITKNPMFSQPLLCHLHPLATLVSVTRNSWGISPFCDTSAVRSEVGGWDTNHWEYPTCLPKHDFWECHTFLGLSTLSFSFQSLARVCNGSQARELWTHSPDVALVHSGDIAETHPEIGMDQNSQPSKNCWFIK